MTDIISKIKEAIKQQGLEASIDPARVVISTQYDLDYQVTIIGLIIYFLKGKNSSTSSQFLKINRMLLRLVHFLVLRPFMISEFKYWYIDNLTEKTPSLEDWTSFPRGFLTDSAQVDTINFLVIRHELVESGKDLMLDIKSSSRINRLTSTALKLNLFAGEITSIKALSGLKMRLNVLGF